MFIFVMLKTIVMESSLLQEFIDWANQLKAEYDSANNNSQLANVADKCMDFIDEFLNRAEEI